MGPMRQSRARGYLPCPALVRYRVRNQVSAGMLRETAIVNAPARA